MTNKKGLEKYADKIGKDMETKNAELNHRNVDIPQEYHEKMLDFVKTLDRERKDREQKNKRARSLRIAAIFLVSFVTLNAAAMGMSEAYRNKFFSLFQDDTSVTLRSENETDLIGDWKGYWYPSGLPTCYKLCAAERDDEASIMLFIDAYGDRELMIQELPIGTSLTYDTETSVREPFIIGSYDGYVFADDLNQIYNVVWKTDDKVISMEFTGDITQNEVKEIASSIKYIK